MTSKIYTPLAAVFGTLSGSDQVPIIKLVSEFAQINQLTSSILNLHTELVMTYTTTDSSKLTKTLTDYYYTR